VALHAELDIYQQSGLTPFQALRAATVNAAEALGMGADLGSLQAGKLADLVVAIPALEDV
jgi:imidazolonepropionase-like amidohydrolase